MVKNKFYPIVLFTLIASILLAACATADPNVVATAIAQTQSAPASKNATPIVIGEATGATQTVGTLGCGQNGRSGDEINVTGYGAPCNTMPLTSFLAIMNAAKGSMPYPYINLLDRTFEGDINAGYQFRNEIPATIPAAQPAQRVLWGSLDWIRELSASERATVEKRILRLRCDGNNPCIYVLVDGDEFKVGWPGRGILLSDPLSPKRDFPWWGK